MIIELDETKTGLSEVRARWMILRHWIRVGDVGYRKDVRAQLIARQHGMCALCPEPLGKDIHIDHIRPIKEIAEDLSLSLTDAILQCWTLSNLRAAHGKKCNLRRTEACRVHNVA